MAELNEIAMMGMPSAAEIESMQIPQRITDALALAVIGVADIIPNLRAHLGQAFPHPDPSILTIREKLDRHHALGEIAEMIVGRTEGIYRV